MGQQDGSIAPRQRTEDAADVVFNTACWGYVHLRQRHRWSRARARSQIEDLLLAGVAAAPAS
jgi:hypothetical protein